VSDIVSPSGSSPPTWSFVAMQYYWLMLNRTFEVFVTGSKLCAARVRGLMASPGFIDAAWKNPQFYVRPGLRSRYESVDPESTAFLGLDNANFQIPRSEISTVEHHRTKWGMGAVPYSGRLVISLTGQRECELVLLGAQDGKAIAARLGRAPPNTSLERTREG
jgi:hypothetical protein